MKLTVLFLFVCSLAVSANGFGQDTKVTLSLKGVKLTKFFKAIEKETSYRFVFSNDIIPSDKLVSIKVKESLLTDVLNTVLSTTKLKYRIVDETGLVVISEKIPDPVIEEANNLYTLTGKVTGDKDEPLSGVTVQVKGSSNATTTAPDGSFLITVAASDKMLVFSFVGMTTQEVNIDGKTNVLVKLQLINNSLNEVVVVGYGTQKKANVTGAISTFKVDDVLGNIPTTNLTSLLSGKMAGINIQTTTGVPGISSNLSIRTNSSTNAAPALFVIDGVVRTKAAFDLLDPNEVATISILKDAASAAIYGSQSSGGVVLVNTKRGKSGKPTLNYNTAYTSESRANVPKLMNAVEGAGFTNYMHPNNADNFFYYWDQNEIDHIKTINNGYGADNVKAVWVTPTTTHHSLSVSGGSDKVRYYAGGSYLKQQGFLQKLDFAKYDVRANVSIDVTKNLTVFAQLTSATTKRNRINFYETDDLGDLYRKLLVWQPDWLLQTSDGHPIDNGWLGNIGEFSKGTSGYNIDKGQQNEMLINAEYKAPFAKGLKFKVQYANNFYELRNSRFLQKQTLYAVKQNGAHQHIWTDTITGTVQSNYPDRPFLQQSSDETKSYQLNLQANYEHSFGDHNLSAFFVYEQTEGNQNSFYGGRETFPVLVVDQFFATSGARTDGYTGGLASESGRLSYIGQLGYNYREKYFLNSSLRRDGSSKFPTSKRWGYFPTVSAGWIVSKESFFNIPQINFLKLRASAALSGNDNVIGWQWLDTYSPSGNAYFGVPPSVNPGIQLDRITNPNITWEKSKDYNTGIDMNFLTHFNFSADYWFKHTYDILGSRIQALPSSFGFALPAENYAKVDAHGVDIELGYENKTGKINYFVRGTFSYGVNKVIQMDYPANAPAYANPNGKPLGLITGYQTDKIIRTQKELDAYPSTYTVFGMKPELGMLTYKDLAGPNGIPDGIIDSYDQTLLSKNSAPPIRYGLNLGASYKSFSVEAMFAGQAGNQRFPDGVNGWVEWNRVASFWLDHWTAENTSAPLPNPKSAFGPNTYTANSNFWLQNAGFVRLKYLSAMYTLPSRVITKVGLSQVKLVVSGTNLFYRSKFKYFDPEVASMGSYPNMRSFNFGLDVTF